MDHTAVGSIPASGARVALSTRPASISEPIVLASVEPRASEFPSARDLKNGACIHMRHRTDAAVIP